MHFGSNHNLLDRKKTSFLIAIYLPNVTTKIRVKLNVETNVSLGMNIIAGEYDSDKRVLDSENHFIPPLCLW